MSYINKSSNRIPHSLLMLFAAVMLTITTLLPSSIPISAEEKYPFSVNITGNGTAVVTYDKVEKTFTDSYETELSSGKEIHFSIEGTDSTIEEVTVNGIELPDFESGYLRRKFTVTTQEEPTAIEIEFKSSKTSEIQGPVQKAEDATSAESNEITSYSPEDGMDVEEIMNTEELEDSPVDISQSIHLQVIQKNDGGTVTVNKTELSKAGDTYDDPEASPYFALSIRADEGYVLADITESGESLSESMIRTDNYTSWENAFLLTKDAVFEITFKEIEETDLQNTEESSASSTKSEEVSTASLSSSKSTQAQVSNLSESDMSYYMNLEPTHALATSDSEQAEIQLVDCDDDPDRDWRIDYDGSEILATARSTNTSSLWTPYDTSANGALVTDPSQKMDCSQWASWVYGQHGFSNVKMPASAGITASTGKHFTTEVRVTTYSWQCALEVSPAVSHTSSNSTTGANPGSLIQFYNTSGTTAARSIHAGLYVGKKNGVDYMINNTHWVTLTNGTKYTYKGVEYTYSGSTLMFEALGVIELPISCITQKGSSSVGSWWIYLTTKETSGKIKVTKYSTNSTLSSSSSSYSLSGAVYGIYSNSSCTTKVGQVTTGSNGVSNTLDLSAGTYYVKEITAPSGFKLSSTVTSVTVKAGETSIAYVYDTPRSGSIQIKKQSSNTTLTNNNDCYSLKDAQYGVYSDSSCTKSVGTLTIADNGYSNTLTGLAPGTYYIKETKAPKGYAIDTAVHSINVVFDETATATYSDVPQSDPVGIFLGKVDAETNANKPQGSGSLANAQFTIKFYAGSYTDGVDPSTLGKSPTRSWTFKTDEDGYVFFLKSYLVSGDALYYNSTSIPTLPLGTYTIQETKAPTGYQLNSTVYVRKVTATGTAENVTTYSVPTIKEQVNTFRLWKYQQEGTQKYAISGTVFTHTKPNGSTQTLTTGSDGYITLKGLETGTHKFVETKAVNGYQINSNEIQITVLADGTIRQDTASLSEKGLSYDASTFTMSVKDETVPYDVSVIKKNENGKLLEGAQFTLYEDAACTKELQSATTDSSGRAAFTSLIPEKVYYVKETKAPEGYRIPLTNGTVKVYTIEARSVPVKNIFTVSVDGTSYSASASNTSAQAYITGNAVKQTLNLNVVNYTTEKLPVTGSNASSVILLAGTALMLFGLKERKKHEKAIQ